MAVRKGFLTAHGKGFPTAYGRGPSGGGYHEGCFDSANEASCPTPALSGILSRQLFEGVMRGRNRNAFEANGHVFFVTSTIVGFAKIFRLSKPRGYFMDALRFYIKRGDIALLAWVLMPNHFHLLMTLLRAASISPVIGGLKRFSSRNIRRLIQDPDCARILSYIDSVRSSTGKTDLGIWMPRFDCFSIESLDTLRQKIEYIHANPVRTGLVGEPTDWPYSSASAYAGHSLADVPVDVEWQSIGY